jgi:acetylornithine deacetylase/succinyl-diaminopimelate desuccinylase-like protein
VILMRFAILLLPLALLAAACAVTPRLLSHEPPHAPMPALDWQQAGDEAAKILSDYLRVDTRNAPGNETTGAQFLAGLLAKDGIPSEILEYAPGRGSLIARLKGTGQDGPLCLLSHVDVVSANAADWPADRQPLSGAIDEHGVIWGRGALDMKGLGVVELLTFLWLHRLHVPLTRDVVLIAVADEEVDGDGARFLVQKHWDKLGCTHLLNEGGIGLTNLLFPGQTAFAISTAEKGLLWVKMTAHGLAGHGSTPIPGRAPERLLAALERIRTREITPDIHSTMYALLREAGEQQGGVSGYVLNRPFLVRQLVTGKLMANPATRAAITNTAQPTMFSGGVQPNVVPSEASATLDCRLLPGTTPAMMLAELQRVVDDPTVTFEVSHGSEANESPVDDPLFRALARHAVHGRTDAIAGPVLSVGYTDSEQFRPKGTHAYGFMPFEISIEEAATMHGANERLSTENLRNGLRILLGAVIEVSTAAP